MARIGIGITTRNRPEMLALCLEHMRAFRPWDCKIVVVEDASDEPGAIQGPPTGVDLYVWSSKRLGIARAKNACLARLQDCDHVFLFDDDAWPKKMLWADDWIEAVEKYGLNHTLWARPVTIIQPTILQTHIEWSNCLGVALHFTRHALNVLGGYAVGPAPYGFEHAAISNRAHRAGLIPTPYVSPLNSIDAIYSVDICWGHYSELPPLGRLTRPPYSSIDQTEAARCNENNILMNDNQIFYPLE